MKRFKKTLSRIVIILFLFLLICLAVYLKNVSDYKHAVRNITFSDIDIAKIPDGTYTGSCDVGFIFAQVEVTVADKSIQAIRIVEHKNDRGKAAETVTEQIVSLNKIDVDAVSGATNSSTVLKKAVENALLPYAR